MSYFRIDRYLFPWFLVLGCFGGVLEDSEWTRVT